jgi:Tfp pilus assembly protein PilX
MNDLLSYESQQLMLVTFVFLTIFLALVALGLAIVILERQKRHERRTTNLRNIFRKDLSAEESRRLKGEQTLNKAVVEACRVVQDSSQKIADLENKLNMNLITLDTKVNKVLLDGQKKESSNSKPPTKKKTKKKVVKKSTKKAAKVSKKKVVAKKVSRGKKK